MKKVTFNYDEIGDQIIDSNGMCVLSGFKTMGYTPIESEAPRLEIKDICKLKEQGFDSAEIIEMHKNGVI